MIRWADRPMFGGAMRYLPVLTLAWGLKAFYRQADAEQLHWILTPTAYLVNLFRADKFQFLEGVGWIEPMGDFVIAPACAGVNFLILLLVLTAVLNLHQLPGHRRKALWLVLTAVYAYAGTVLVNAVRILLSIPLYQAEVYGGWLTPERAHRLAGIFLYLSALWLLLSLVSLLALRLSRWRGPSVQPRDFLAGRRPYLVIALYGGLTIGVPLVNGAYGRFGGQYVEHSLTVGAIGLFTLVLWGGWNALKSARDCRDGTQGELHEQADHSDC